MNFDWKVEATASGKPQKKGGTNLQATVAVTASGTKVET